MLGIAILSGNLGAVQLRSTTTIIGEVILETGERVSGATVKLRVPGLPSDLIQGTDESGHFKFSDVPPGVVRVTAAKPPFVILGEEPTSAKLDYRLLSVPANGQTLRATLVLAMGAVISGRVATQDEVPAIGSKVSLFKVRSLGNNISLREQPIRTVVADDRGHYRIDCLQPGQYSVMAEYHGRGQTTQYLPTFHPNSAEASSAVAVQIERAQTQDQIDIYLNAAQAFTIQGAVVTPPGVSVAPGGSFALIAARFGPVAGRVRDVGLDKDGGFSVSGVLPGRYELRGQVVEMEPGKGQLAMWIDEPLTVSDSDVRLTLSLKPGGMVSGRIVQQGATIRRTLQLILKPPRSEPAGGRRASLTTTDDDGKFSFADLPPGEYTIGVTNAGPDAWPNRVLQDGAEVNNISVDAGHRSTLTVVVGPPTELIATLVSPPGNSSATYAAAAFPCDADQWLDGSPRLQATSVTGGAFQFTGLPPGHYCIGVSVGIDPEDLLENEVLAALKQQSIPIDLHEGETRSVEIRLKVPSAPDDLENRAAGSRSRSEKRY